MASNHTTTIVSHINYLILLLRLFVPNHYYTAIFARITMIMYGLVTHDNPQCHGGLFLDLPRYRNPSLKKLGSTDHARTTNESATERLPLRRAPRLHLHPGATPTPTRRHPALWACGNKARPAESETTATTWANNTLWTARAQICIHISVLTYTHVHV